VPAYGRTLVLALAFGGWAVVAFVVAVLPVTPPSQAVFYSAGFAALAGSWALLRELYQNRRGLQSARSLPPLGAIHFLGSGMRFAAAVEFALWLQSLRMLTVPYVALLTLSYLGVEYLFRAAETRST
jgi:hypothetical protein